jgi:hypothetical protein
MERTWRAAVEPRPSRRVGRHSLAGASRAPRPVGPCGAPPPPGPGGAGNRAAGYAAQPMDLRRLRIGEWITAGSGICLLVSLFLPWYGSSSAPDTSGWQSLALLDIVLALIAATAVALLVVTAAQRLPAVPLTLNTFVALAGLLAVVLVLVRLADLPGDADAREWGLWIGLAGALGIAAGALVAMRDERPARPGRHTDLSGRPAPSPPELEAIPAPDLESRR